MADRLREIPKKILEWWNKFSPKQKTMIVCAFAGVMLAGGILVYCIGKPQYEVLMTCENSKETSQITTILDSNAITYKTSQDALTISVLKSQVGTANLVLGANDIVTDTFSSIYGWENVTNGGFSTTETDKQRNLVHYNEEWMASVLQTNENIKKAYVSLTVPEDDGTLIAQSIESSAAVVLDVDGEVTSEMANGFAHFIAASLGNSSTDKVTIIDSKGNLLYSGETQTGGIGAASTQLAAKQEVENLVKQEVKSVLLGTNLYDNIEVASHLSLDFSTLEEVIHDYYAPEGQTQGVLASEDLFSSEAVGGVAGEPGTGSNGENGTTYMLQDDAYSSQTQTEERRKYLPGEKVSTRTVLPGVIQYDESSISISAKKLHLYNEDDVRAQGLLNDISWEEFQRANADQIKLEVDEDLYSVVHTATGIPTESITIVAYEVPVFIDAAASRVTGTDIVTILLIIAILGVLAFVVIRSMAGRRGEEPEEELSVESLLQSTPQPELEDINLEGKSDARIMIEKFVDENPEAVANLLRNWLTEDWG